jgi:GT2 family glycosyltransferase
MNDHPLVSVVVLSYNRPVYLQRALDSIVGQTYTALEVIVVDNKSAASEEVARLVRGYGGVRLVQNGGNPGYTGGMNRGLAEASGDYVYFTVDDVLLERDCVERLVSYDLAHPSKGLLTGIIMNEDRRTICCAGGEFSLTPVYLRKYIGAGERDAGQFSEAFEVSCLDGAMVFSRRDFMRALGGFREEFFMYSDSIELSARVLKAGGRITVVPQVRAYASHSPHDYTHDGILFHKMKNLYAMYLLHARWRVLPEFFLRYGVLVPLRSMLANRKLVWPQVKAWAWFLSKAPSLLQERRRG